jgi:glyoxylase-like metal-dependent hydrolase (beta-lactamase superfamily II)|tara:strand:- start:1004 stop:1558 length:555 start_codon:yes stop_codon:yes gene_type:complete
MEQLTDNVWKIHGLSNCYLLDVGAWILIDTGAEEEQSKIKEQIESIIPVDKITKVLLTHLHYDHIGNWKMFKNATFYAHPDAIAALKENAFGAVLDQETATNFKAPLEPLTDIHGLKVILTPGHTKGIVCLHYPEKKILFSGDTLFDGRHGRTDFPFSDPAEMETSLKKLEKIEYDILAPGHDV